MLIPTEWMKDLCTKIQWTPLIWKSVSLFLPMAILTNQHLATTLQVNSIDFFKYQTDTTETAVIPHLKQVWKGANMQVLHSSSQHSPAQLPQQLSLYPPAKMGGRKHHLFGWRGKSQSAAPWLLGSSYLRPLVLSQLTQPCNFPKLRASWFYWVLLSKFS